jgi:SRSO17 transposase
MSGIFLERSAMSTGRCRRAITASGCCCRGPGKSGAPMAAVTAPGRVPAQHQSLLHLVGTARWSDERVLSKVRDLVLPSLERHGPIVASIIDDTGFPKKGRHSVGVTLAHVPLRAIARTCRPIAGIDG